jgi:tetratricopeptide (TPR) repeat protein
MRDDVKKAWWPLRHVAALLMALVLSASAPAFAQSPSVAQADGLMSAWQLEEARQVIDALKQGRVNSGDLRYLEGRYAFYEGRYEEAVKLLDEAIAEGGPRPHWVQLREIVAATHEVTKSYERHVSPSGRFEIFIEPGQDRVLLPYAFEALEAAYEAFGEEIGYKPKTPIRVEVYPRTAVLAKVSTLTEEEIRTSGTIALCQYNRLMITSPRALLRGYGWVDTLIHEYVHYVINSKTYNRVPIWMHEGLAKYLERRWRGPDAHKLPLSSEQLLYERLKANTLISFDDMHPSMAKLPSQEDAALAFAEVYTVMEYFQKQVGPGAFAKLLDTINDGLDAPDAFARVLGTTFKAFERDWLRYLKTRPVPELPDDTSYEDRLVFKEDPKIAGELDQIEQPQARDHILLGEMLQARNRYGAAVVQYQKAVDLIGTNNPVLQTRLAQSLISTNRPKEAIEQLEAVKEIYPSYIATWLEMGRAYLVLEDWANARDHLREAARINPFNPEIHSLLARAYDKLGQAELAAQAREFAQLVR